jgi:hypothetical protein
VTRRQAAIQLAHILSIGTKRAEELIAKAEVQCPAPKEWSTD